MMGTQTDGYLVEEVLAGNTKAYAVLVNRYKDMVFTLAVGLLHNRQEAEEVAQDTFLKAFKALSGFQNKSKFSTWIYRIIYNECISRLRRKKNNLISVEELSYGELSDNFEEIEPEWIQKEKRKRQLYEAISLLKEDDRSILMLYYFENCRVNEISDITSLSNENIKSRLFRARKKLHSILTGIKKKELIDY
jgi:RNA polymerase sigma-70 factor (ECF subfamily)